MRSIWTFLAGVSSFLAAHAGAQPAPDAPGWRWVAEEPWVMEYGSGPRRFPSDQEIQFSPDDQRVAWLRRTTDAVEIYLEDRLMAVAPPQELFPAFGFTGNSRHFFCAQREGFNLSMAFDGVPGDPYDQIDRVIGVGEDMVFFLATRNGEAGVGVRGDGVDAFYPGTFSAGDYGGDYVVSKDGHLFRWVRASGPEGRSRDSARQRQAAAYALPTRLERLDDGKVIAEFAFPPDAGIAWASLARDSYAICYRLRNRNEFCLIADGGEWSGLAKAPQDGNFVRSSDGRRWAALLDRGMAGFEIVLDGKSLGVLTGTASMGWRAMFEFDRGGRFVAAVNCYAFADDRVIRSDRSVRHVAISPDGRRVAVMEVGDDKQWYVKVDEQTFGPFMGVARAEEASSGSSTSSRNPIKFSPDSSRVMFKAVESGLISLRLDGQRHGPFRNLSVNDYGFLPDNRAYWRVRGDDKDVLHVEGEPVLEGHVSTSVMVDGHLVSGVNYGLSVDGVTIPNPDKAVAVLVDLRGMTIGDWIEAQWNRGTMRTLFVEHAHPEGPRCFWATLEKVTE